MRLQAGPREDEPRYKREEDGRHQAQHPGRPISTPQVDYRGAAQAGVSHVVSVPPAGSIREAGRRLKFRRRIEFHGCSPNGSAIRQPGRTRRDRRTRRRELSLRYRANLVHGVRPGGCPQAFTRAHSPSAASPALATCSSSSGVAKLGRSSAALGAAGARPLPRAWMEPADPPCPISRNQSPGSRYLVKRCTGRSQPSESRCLRLRIQTAQPVFCSVESGRPFVHDSLRWRELDSNFPYAGAMSLVFAPFVSLDVFHHATGVAMSAASAIVFLPFKWALSCGGLGST